MKIVFLGTPDFAVPSLEKLCDSRHEVIAVVTQTDKPVGRHGKVEFSPVKETALKRGIKVLQYNKIRAEGVDDLRALNADIFVTCAYGQILSQEIIGIPKYGIINVHGSLLPKYRGAAPIQWAILNGDKYTGITIMRTEAGVDTGDMLMQRSIEIGERETAGELFERLSGLGAEMIVEAVDLIERGEAVYTPQDHSAATHVRMLKKTDGIIDWSRSSEDIDRWVRGMNPWPSAYTYYMGKSIKIWSVEICQPTDVSAPCGTVLTSDRQNGITVKTGDGSVRIIELQLEGSRRMFAGEYLLGRSFKVGERLSGEQQW